MTDFITPPTLTNPIPEINVTEGQNFNFTFADNTFTDLDPGDELTYSATLENGNPLPSGLSFVPETQTLSGNLGYTDPLQLLLHANDKGGNRTSTKVTIDVHGSGKLLTEQKAITNHPFNFQVPTPQDPRFPTTYSATLLGGQPLPAWLTFDPNTKTLSGTPKKTDAGYLNVVILTKYNTSSDPNTHIGNEINQLTIHVQNINNPPTVVNPIPAQGVLLDHPFTYIVPDNTFTDYDGGTPVYSVTLADGTPLPTWLTFNPATRTFSGTPSVANYGVINVNVKATDSENESSNSTFALYVDIDAAQYGASYSDLIKAYGDNLPAISQHYRDFGRAAGRTPDLFDENRYVASNKDLIADPNIVNPTTRLVNADGAALHYIRHGFGENRSLTSFQGDQYIASYKDLITNIGYNINAGDVHYIQHGIPDGRSPDLFDEYRYLAGYDDLLNVYKTDVVGATKQYIEFGAKPPENRDPFAFKPDIYLATYGDLIDAFKTTTDYASKLQLASVHYVISGRGETRSRGTFNPQTYLANHPDIAADPLYASDPTRHYIEHGHFENRI